jgi:hypothetical protein
MVIIDSIPQKVSFVRNNIDIVSKALSPFQSVGAKAIHILTFTGDGLDGDGFTLSWNNIELVFSCKNNPDSSISTDYPSAQYIDQMYYQIIPRATGDWEKYVFRWLKTNYYITRDFQISLSGNQITFEAREMGAAYHISYAAGNGSMTWGTSQAGVDQELKDGFKLFLRTYLNQELLAEDRLSVGAEQKAEFNLQSLIELNLNQEIDWPLSSRFAKVNHFFEITYDYGEFYDNQVQRVYNGDDSFFAIPGGIPKQITAQLNKKETSIKDWIFARRDFLTWLPDQVYIGYYQPLLLRYPILDASTQANMKLTLFFTDGSSELVSDSLLVSEYEAVQVYLFIPDLQNTRSKVISKIQVHIENAAGMQLTKKRSFLIDRKPWRNQFYFLFQNSLGSFETVRALGEYRDEKYISRSEYNTKHSGTEMMHELKQDISFVSRLRFNTGSLINQALDPVLFRQYFTDFILSEKIYLVAENNLYPFVLNMDKTITMASDSRNPSIEFEGSLAMEENVYGMDPRWSVSGFNSKFNDKFKKS